MAQQHSIRSIAPEALAAAGVVDRRGGGGRVTIEPPDPGRPWHWRRPPDLLARLTAGADPQADLSRRRAEAARTSADPVRLTLYAVPRPSRHALVTRLTRARPGIGALVIADHAPDHTLRQLPLRGRTLAMVVVAFGDARRLVGDRGAVTDHPPGGTP
ncbi:hypothetical protein ACFZDG_27885 [Kitasatospora xanthocidica]|uniref:hypothetical protein n=1 Tax=Kitasatospora xanthocidica TaxID=83382 RepID=UPI0036E537D7